MQVTILIDDPHVLHVHEESKGEYASVLARAKELYPDAVIDEQGARVHVHRDAAAQSAGAPPVAVITLPKQRKPPTDAPAKRTRKTKREKNAPSDTPSDQNVATATE